MIVGIDHGYYAIKTRQVSFPSGIIRYDYEPPMEIMSSTEAVLLSNFFAM